MTNGFIAIIDSEKEYAFRLAQFFRNKNQTGYTIQVFTDIFSFLDFEQSNYIDMLIITEIFGDYVSSLKNTGQIFILSEGSLDISLTEYSSIYKYQSSDNILREVMSYYAPPKNPSARISLTGSDTHFTCIYSPINRCGKTTFAIAYGCLLAKQDSTLLLSLDEYSCLSYFTGCDYTNDLSDLLYFYKQSPALLDKKLIAMSHNIHGLDYIPPFRFPWDVTSLDEKEWCDFFRDIILIGKYKNLILDLSNLIANPLPILDMTDTIFFPIHDDQLSDMKLKRFKETIALGKHNTILEKLSVLTLPMIDFDFPDNRNNPLNSIFYGNYGQFIQNVIDNGKH